MRNKIIIFMMVLMLTGLACAQDWPAFNVCCEKTSKGAWCQNTLDENCENSIDSLTGDKYRSSPTSCESTSFCKPGCCVDSEEGLCMKNTPKRVCEISTGTWVDDKECNVAQCSLGCCVLGDQASFVTLTRCKRLSGLYGLETNFKKDVGDEASCIMLAYSQDKGACVYESDGQKTCKFITRAECSNYKEGTNASAGTEFFKDYLCSSDELATECGPTTETVCVEGKYEVYFKDSCGNPANIYDANRVYSKDPSYWQKIFSKSESCGYGKSNINSKTCGNCEYLSGSICGEGNARVGDYVCKDLNCYDTENGKDYKNGESWCMYQSETGNGVDSVGSRHFRHVCIHGEEIVEPCADFRNEVCIEEEVSGVDFIEAACRVNRWQDCIDQFEEEDCLNKDKRDCYWIKGASYDGSKSGAKVQQLANTTGNESKGIMNEGHICLPNVPPGLTFWEEGDAGNTCSLGNSKQTVKYKENVFGSRECEDNCGVLEQSWVVKMNDVCTSLGDCGAYHNLAGKHTDGGVLWKVNGNKKTIEDGILQGIKGASGDE